MARRPIETGRRAEGGVGMHVSRADFDSPKSLASGMYRFWSWLCHVYVQLLAAADSEVGVRRAVQHRSWLRCYDSQSPWADRDDHCVSSLRPQAGEAIPHGNPGCFSWNCFSAAGSASLSLLLCCSFFSRGHRGIQLFARFLFGAWRIPDRLLCSRGYRACDIGLQLGRVRGALYGRHYSAEDRQLALRPDLRGSFFLYLSELGTGLAQARPSCS